MGTLLADKNIRLVYGGANVGMMGTVANACLKNGGEVIGVMPRHLVNMEVVHQNLTELKVVETMHERKALMSELSDGFIALPGGIGTLEETLEIFTWIQLGLQLKPLGLLNVLGFYDKLRLFLEEVVKKGFLLDQHLEMLLMEKNVQDLLISMESNKPRKILKWSNKEEHTAN
ncbi:MAG: TIGR00730 family Rossman fold protein [bacterium]|nr:TIGR00730 family Rossman fold protein [bacterium]